MIKEKKFKIQLEGMMCKHCQMKIENVLKNIKEIKKYKVNLRKQEVIFKSDLPLDISLIKQNIEELGYKVVNLEEL